MPLLLLLLLLLLCSPERSSVLGAGVPVHCCLF